MRMHLDTSKNPMKIRKERRKGLHRLLYSMAYILIAVLHCLLQTSEALSEGVMPALQMLYGRDELRSLFLSLFNHLVQQRRTTVSFYLTASILEFYQVHSAFLAPFQIHSWHVCAGAISSPFVSFWDFDISPSPVCIKTAAHDALTTTNTADIPNSTKYRRW